MMIIKSYDEHGNVREPVVEPEPPVILESPEGDWQLMVAQCLISIWAVISRKSCEECAGNEQAQIPSSKDESSFLRESAERIINY